MQCLKSFSEFTTVVYSEIELEFLDSKYSGHDLFIKTSQKTKSYLFKSLKCGKLEL